jgi:hypothetical protein
MTISPDIQATFDYLFNLAAKPLQAGNQSFEPFATAVTEAGERTHSTTDLGTLTSSPTEHIGALLAVLADQARAGPLKSAGVVFNARTPQGLEGGDECVCLHVETPNDSVQIFVPYKRAHVPPLAFAEAIVQDAAPRIFPR